MSKSTGETQARYIDVARLKHILLQEAKKELNIETHPFSWSFAYECFAERLDTIYDAIQTDEVVPVIHAHWENCQYGMTCYNCKGIYITPDDIYDYRCCPRCGARMDEEVEESEEEEDG